jgi:hypothetical protein
LNKSIYLLSFLCKFWLFGDRGFGFLVLVYDLWFSWLSWSFWCSW